MPKALETGPATKSETGQVATHLSNQNENFEAVIKTNEALASGVTALGQEVMEFTNKRVSENLSLSESFAHCKNAGEAFEVNYEFAQKATLQYLEEASRLLALTGQISRQFWTPLEERTRKVLHDANGD